MGDIADMIYQQFCDGGWDDDDEAPPHNYGTCRRCGKKIEFIHSGVRWRLYEPGARKLHACANPASPDEFPDLD